MYIENYANGKFYLADCFEVFHLIKDGSIDMVLADLPYGTTQNKWDSILPLDKLWNEYWRIIKPNGAIVLTAQTPFDKVLGVSCLPYLKYEWIWSKRSGTGHLNAKKQPLKSHENILVFYKSQPLYNPQFSVGKPYKILSGRQSTNYGNQINVITDNDGKRYPKSVLEFDHDRISRIHPTQKPVALFEYLIKTYTHEGEIVLDNVAGSGTTAVAAENTNRRWVCIEQDENYFYKANERIKENNKNG